MKTTEDVLELGLYASECCNEELIFFKSDCFSRCPRCEELCKWQLVEKLVSWKELERVDVEPAA